MTSRRAVCLPLLALLLLCLAPLSSRAAQGPLPALRPFEAEWRATLPDGSPGYGAALSSPAAPTPADWVEPGAAGVLAVGFDVQNPKPDKPFGPDGNIYGRPEREVSLHWNGVEVANRSCPVELRGKAGGGHRARWKVEPVVGGAAVSVFVDGTAVYDRFFVPEVAFPAADAVKLTFGGGADVKPGKERWGRPVAVAAPVRVVAFDAERNDKAHHRATAEAAFPDDLGPFGRVVCTLTLAPTPEGIDPWDRLAQFFVYDGAGERFEVLRYITPYRKGWTWKADVTDLMPLLSGRRKTELFCETWAEGWLVSVAFDFYPGKLSRRPYKVVNLWNGTAVLGQAEKPVDRFFAPRTVPVDAGAREVRARFSVTGHGQAPNTNNAAEFLPLWRRLTVGQETWQDTLWKQDVYLNPCRPQGGTWKYDRAGWAPGDVVTPWLVDVSRAVEPGRPATLRYEVEPYVNKTPDAGNPARQVVESQLIFYR